MHTSFTSRLIRRLSCLVGALGFVAAGPILPLGVTGLSVLAGPAPAIAQDKATGDDEIVFTSGKVIKGKILEETPTAVTIKFLSGGIEATMTYPKSEILKVTKGTGPAPAQAPSSAPNASQPEIKAAAGAADPGEPGKKKVYVIELTGEFGKDISETPIRNAVKDAKKHNPEILLFIMDNDWSRSGGMEEIKDDEGAFDQLFRAEKIAPILNEEIPREWAVQPTIVFWVKKAMGGAAFLPLNCRNIYFHSEGKMGGIAGLNRQFTQGDKVVWEKQISLRITTAEGMAILGGYEPRLIKAMCRDEYVLSYKLEGGKPVYLERMPSAPEEILLTDDADEQSGNKDGIQGLARGEGNDCLTITSDLAFKLGVSKGTVDSFEDVMYKLGIARNYEKIEGGSKRIMKGWASGLEDARRHLRKLWDEFENVQVADPGGYDQRTQARNKRRSICDQMQRILKQYEEALSNREVPCPSWADLNIIKERLKTEQLADRRDPR